MSNFQMGLFSLDVKPSWFLSHIFTAIIHIKIFQDLPVYCYDFLPSILVKFHCRKVVGGNSVASADTPDVLNASSFRPLWISWNNGAIRVGNGSTVGLGTFLSYTDPSAVPVNYIAISGWDTSGIATVTYGETTTVTFHSINRIVSVAALNIEHFRMLMTVFKFNKWHCRWVTTIRHIVCNVDKTHWHVDYDSVNSVNYGCK